MVVIYISIVCSFDFALVFCSKILYAMSGCAVDDDFLLLQAHCRMGIHEYI
jgi:hypothetical protein